MGIKVLETPILVEKSWAWWHPSIIPEKWKALNRRMEVKASLAKSKTLTPK
jgi:hypothetical protein